MSFPRVAAQLKNVSGKAAGLKAVQNAYNNFSEKAGRVKSKYEKCGRKPWKLDEATKKFIVKRMLQLRKKGGCTSTVLQKTLASERKVVVEPSANRKVLAASGYKWLPRGQKKKYSTDVMNMRLKFAKQVVRMSIPALEKKVAFSLDGVVITIPPKNDVQRANHCFATETHMWRKPDERALPEFAGSDDYVNQAPVSRCLPMWGGIGIKGASHVVFHASRKITEDEWTGVVEQGTFKDVLKRMSGNMTGPWTVISDNEGFLRTAASNKAHRQSKVSLWGIPPRSPDLNPVEKYWSWLRKRLRTMDLQDLSAKRAVPDKAAYKQRVVNIMRSKASQKVARACIVGLKAVCQKVFDKNGAASGS